MLAEGMVSLHPGFVSTRNLASSRLMVLQNAAQEKPPFHACGVSLLLGLSVRYIELLIQLHGQAGP